MGAKRHPEIGGLTVQEEKMVRLYLFGPKDLLGNQSRCYEAVYVNESKEWKDSTLWTKACLKFTEKQIKERIKELLNDSLTEEWVKSKLIKEVEEGEHARDRIKAVELLGKTHAMFKEKQEVEIKMQGITLDEEKPLNPAKNEDVDNVGIQGDESPKS